MKATLGDAYLKFQGIMKLKREADRKVMDLLHNPHTQPEHLVAVHQIILNVDKAMSEVVTQLRSKWDGRQVIPTPWNVSEFDRYDKRHEVKED